jgi:hypothetical protein
VLAGIRDTRELSDEAQARVEEIAKVVVNQFAPSVETPAPAPEAEAEDAEAATAAA